MNSQTIIYVWLSSCVLISLKNAIIIRTSCTLLDILLYSSGNNMLVYWLLP